MLDAQYELHADIEDRHWWFVGRRAIVRRLLTRLVPPGPEVQLLDVGCGTGANIAAFAGSYRCIGTDASPRAVELARARYAGVDYTCEPDARALADQVRAASGVLLMDVLEHVEDDFAMLSQLLASLRPGAHLLITVPADPSLWTEHDESFGHWRRYDVERLRATWRDLPVDERLMSPYNARLYPIIKTVRAVSKLRKRASGAAGTDFNMPAPFVNQWLERLFAGEVSALEKHIDRGTAPYRRGASLVAILRRRDGEVTPRAKPPGLPADRRPHGASPGA